MELLFNQHPHILELSSTMPLSVALRRVVDENPAPEIFDADLEEKVFTHRSLYPISAHIQITEHEPRDWER
jgi:hypothetical protein